MSPPIAPAAGPTWTNRIQVLLLGLTSLVLSLASGWTTWLGMTNFTHEAVLSLMITFGIQGVMMVLSWVLGSRLANDQAVWAAAKAVRNPYTASPTVRTVEWLLISSIIFLALNLIAQYFGLFDLLRLSKPTVSASIVMFLAIGLALLTILVLIPYGPELVRGTVRALVTGTKHIVVISMLAACLFASVFFSFDSLFSRILPDDERRRIADFRSRSVVMDIRSTLQVVATDEQAARRKALFGSAAWSGYNSQLEEIATALRAVPPAIDAQLVRDRQEQRQTLDRSSSQAARIEIERGRIERKRSKLQSELKTAREQSGVLQTTLAALSEQIAQSQRRIAIKAAELEAEANGLGSSRQKGRGPAYRELAKSSAVLESGLLRLSAERKVVQAQRDRLAATIADLEVQVADRANAEQRLSHKAKGLVGSDGLRDRGAQLAARKANVLSQLADLRNARQQFESDTSSDTLGTLQSRCTSSFDALQSDAGQSARKSNLTCDTNALRASAAPLFALKIGRRKLESDCQTPQARGDSGFETEVAIARECIVKSGLLPALTAPITAKLDLLERERDDKAHRFVVSMNAFLDGNKLAFLAAGIALAIDLLVLASGLLGALALRTRVLDVAIPIATIASELDGGRRIELARVLKLALDDGAPQENARRILKYIEPAELGTGIGMKVEITEVADEDTNIVRQFLNAGTAFAQVYSTAIPSTAVGIDNGLYLAVLDLADQNSKPFTRRNDAGVGSSASAGLRERLASPAGTFRAAAWPELSKPNEANTSQTAEPAHPDKVIQTTLPLVEPEQTTETATVEASTVGAAETNPRSQPRQTAVPPTTEQTEDQLVSVANGNFKFDFLKR